MTHEKMPEALRLAIEFEECIEINAIPSINDVEKSAAELRRQHAEIERLRAEVEELRKDAERLDFVEKNPHIALKWHRKCKWWMDTSINYEKDCFATARQAIDAAMQSTKEQL